MVDGNIKDEIQDKLSLIADPHMGISIVEMGLVRDITVDEDNNVYIYYASSDTRLHVATTTVDKLIAYTFNTPQDPYRSLLCTAQRQELIEKNEELLKSEN